MRGVRFVAVAALTILALVYWIRTPLSVGHASSRSSSSNNGFVMDSSTSNSSTANSLLYDAATQFATGSRRSSRRNEAASPSVKWMPGGVADPTFDVSAAQKEIDIIFQSNVVSSSKAIFCNHFENDVRDGSAYYFFRRLTRHVAPLAVKPEFNADCLMHLPPHQKAACLIAQMLSQGNDEDENVYQQSACRELLPCVLWSRGRFSTNMTADVLDSAYRSVAVRFTEQRSILTVFQKNFIHTAQQPNELPWLSERCRVHATEATKWKRLSENKEAYPNMDTPMTKVLGALQGDLLSLAAESENHLAEAILIRQSAGGGGAGRKDGVLTATLNTLTSMETIALLSHFVTSRARSLGVSRSVILFSGDSQNREVFYRLIRLIRYVAADKTEYFESPYFEVLGHADWIYTVFIDHDELQMFPTTSKNKKNNNQSVDSFLLSHVENDNVLFHIVFLWDRLSASTRDAVWSYATPSSTPSPLWARIGVAAHVEGTTAWDTTRHSNMYARFDAVRRKNNSIFFSMSATAKMTMANDHNWTQPPLRGLSSLPPHHLVAPSPSLSSTYSSAAALQEAVSKVSTDAASAYFNLRNVEHFQWLYKSANAFSPSSSYVAILDNAKLQLLPNSLMSDAIHFSCHAYAASFAKHFAATTRREALQALFGERLLSRLESAACPLRSTSNTSASSSSSTTQRGVLTATDNQAAAAAAGNETSGGRRNQRRKRRTLVQFLASFMAINGNTFRDLGYITGKEDENMQRTGYAVRGVTFYVAPKRGPQLVCRNRPQLLLVNLLLFTLHNLTRST